MNFEQTKYRLILVTGLVAAIGAVGVAPDQVAGTSCPITVQTTGGSHGCCCGATGQCRCGPTCCQAPAAPTQDRAPAPPKPSDEMSLAIGLGHTGNLAIDSPAAANWHRLPASHWLAAVDSSLLALSVRLNF
jgi:hypothetical protein